MTHGTWKTTGGGGPCGITAGGIVTLFFVIWSYVELSKHARAIGHGAVETLDIVALTIGILSVLTVVTFGSILAVALHRRLNRSRPATYAPAGAGKAIEPASQAQRNNLLVGRYGQPAITQAHSTSQPAITPPAEVHQHLHFHTEDPVEAARQWRESQQGSQG